MKKIMNYAFYFFVTLALCSLAMVLYAQEIPTTKSTLLPDANSAMYSTIISALGGFSGGGLLLIFLIRRLVTSYDENFSKMDTRCHRHTQQQTDNNTRIIDMVEEIRGITQDLKFEVIKLQATTADKDSVMEVMTKVAMFEADVNQVRSEVKSIMTHLLNKQKSSSF